MSKISMKATAPDFELADFNGKNIRLSNYKGISNVLLIFNRGFF